MKRSLYAAGIGAGILFSLEPFAGALAGTGACLCIILLAESLARERIRVVLFWSCATALSITLFAFQWIAHALMNIAHLPLGAAALVTVVYALLFNLKIPFFFLAARLQTRIPVSGVVLYPVLGLAGDLLFYQIFPWYFGNMTGSAVLLQSARLTGVYGLSFLLFLQAAAILHAFRFFRKTAEARPLAFAVPLLALAYAYGIITLAQSNEPRRILRIAYVQPATSPGLNEHRNDEFAARALSTVLNLGLKSIIDAEGKADLLILPESSVPFLGTNDSKENIEAGVYSTTFHAVIAGLSRFGGVDVLYNELNFESGLLRNQATLFGREGLRKAVYNKQHLVPFGEYLPLEDVLPLRRFFPEASRYARGSGPSVLETSAPDPASRRPLLPPVSAEQFRDARIVLENWPAVPQGQTARIAPLVCYEGMFPGLVQGFLKTENVDFFVNIANDAWFGDYLENYQHSGAVRLRAVETGRSVVRITLTGVSTAFGPRGENLSAESKPGEMATGLIEVPVFEGRTVYSIAGLWPLYALLTAFSIWAGICLRRSRPSPDAATKNQTANKKHR